MTRPLVSVLALAASALVAGAALAASPTAERREAAVQPQAFTSVLKLQKAWYDTANPGAPAAAGSFTPYGGPLTVACSNAAGCFIKVDTNVQMGSAATASNVAVCVKINGTSTDGCPYNATLPTSGFTVLNYQSGLSVGVGNHVVTTEVFTPVASTFFRYNTEVRLYKK